MGNLNLNRQAAEEGYSVIPEDDYVLMCVSADEGPSKNNPNNRSVKAKFEVMEGPYTGRSFMENYNTVHENETTWKIGHQGLYRLGLAVGLRQPPDDTDELLSKPFRARVVVKVREDTGDNQNQIKAYYTLDGKNVNEIRKELKGASGGGTNAPSSPSVPQPPQRSTTPAPPPPPGGQPSWLNKQG